MSDLDELFFDPGDDSHEQVAQALTHAWSMEISISHGYFVVHTAHYSGEWPLTVSGWLRDNSFVSDYPGEEAAFDHCPVLVTLRTVPRSGEPLERALALQLLRDLALAQPTWTQVLTWNFDLLDAIYDPHRGERVFPPLTSADVGWDELWAGTVRRVRYRHLDRREATSWDRTSSRRPEGASFRGTTSRPGAVSPSIRRATELDAGADLPSRPGGAIHDPHPHGPVQPRPDGRR